MRYNDVTLIDGTVADSGSEAWRLECEARAVLDMPTKAARQNYLNGYTDINQRKQQGVVGRRGHAAQGELQAKIMQVWKARQVVA